MRPLGNEIKLTEFKTSALPNIYNILAQTKNFKLRMIDLFAYFPLVESNERQIKLLAGNDYSCVK